MKIEEYIPQFHLEHVQGWLRARGKPIDLCNNLPNIGYAISNGNDLVAVMFLRLMEGRMGVIDGLCTNPGIPGETRNLAIDALTHQILKRAREIELRAIVAWTEDNNTLERSFRHGFKRFAATMMTYDLKG